MRDDVREYYGQTLQGSADLRTDACATIAAPPQAVRAAMAHIHPDVAGRYYGCGLVIPPLLEGARVLDLGCGAGRDAYILAQLVGETGRVVGVDMTPEQLAVAREAEAWHAERFGYAAPNTRFLEGYIEALDALDLAPGSFDVIVSNCVLNLSPAKDAVLAGAKRLLKPGGEFYFADVYADRRLDPALREDPALVGECLGGALYWKDFLRLAKAAGFPDPRLVEDRPIAIGDPRMKAATAPARFFSATYRLFNIEGLEDACEDYGQAVIYTGGIEDADPVFMLDKHHDVEAGRVVPACGNTVAMLTLSRFGPYFEVVGDGRTHRGVFAGCGEVLPFDGEAGDDIGACC